MLDLHTHAQVCGVSGVEILKVLGLDEALTTSIDPAKCLLWLAPGQERPLNFPWRGCFSLSEGKQRKGSLVVHSPKNPKVVQPGDVILLIEGKSLIQVLYRRSSHSNTLFATERCDSNCLMCSQPPRMVDDSWRVGEILETILLMDQDVDEVGLSGGEPTLLGDDLLSIILSAKNNLPQTRLHILSNGKAFEDSTFTKLVSAVKHPNIEWGIPFYSSVEHIHDEIVQSKGSWAKTLKGLYNLHEYGNSVEIRIVVQKLNADHLGEISRFIFRNLSFVNHVAFMGLEPMGYAKKNKDQLWLDPKDFSTNLKESVLYLTSRGINASVYNLALCTLDGEIWPFAKQSISDWKNIYLECCSHCAVRQRCAGFFKSTDKTWIGKNVHPLQAVAEE